MYLPCPRRVNGDLGRVLKLAMPAAFITQLGDEISSRVEFLNRIQVFSGEGEFIFEWGTRGSRPGQFYFPRCVAVDLNGNIYVADTRNHRIQVFTSLAEVSERPLTPHSIPRRAFAWSSGRR